jgi:hypothetical protein
MREIAALEAVIAVKPGNPEEARDKLLYLMALMTSNAAVLAVSEVERAIHTLRPFRPDLAVALGSKAPEAGSEMEEGQPPLLDAAHRTAQSRR